VSGSGSLKRVFVGWKRAIEIVEQGGSVFEVMSHLSHSEPKTSAIYTKRVDRAHLARQAADRVEAAGSVEGQEAPESVPRPSVRGTHALRKTKVSRLSENQWQSLGESNPSFQVESPSRKRVFVLFWSKFNVLPPRPLGVAARTFALAMC